MDKKEVNNTRWDQYQIMTPELPKEDMEGMLDILENLDNRKIDKVNWDEREAMNEATKRSGHILSIESEGGLINEDGEEILDETAGATSDKEKDLMGTLGGIMQEWEKQDGQ